MRWLGPDRFNALEVRRPGWVWSTTVLPVLPSLHDCLSNRWKFYLLVLLLFGSGYTVTSRGT